MDIVLLFFIDILSYYQEVPPMTVGIGVSQMDHLGTVKLHRQIMLLLSSNKSGAVLVSYPLISLLLFGDVVTSKENYDSLSHTPSLHDICKVAEVERERLVENQASCNQNSLCSVLRSTTSWIAYYLQL